MPLTSLLDTAFSSVPTTLTTCIHEVLSWSPKSGSTLGVETFEVDHTEASLYKALNRKKMSRPPIVLGNNFEEQFKPESIGYPWFSWNDFLAAVIRGTRILYTSFYDATFIKRIFNLCFFQ